MRRGLDIHGLRSQVWTGDRLQGLRCHGGADTCSVVGWLSFRRIVDIPFETCVAALDSWQPTGKEGEPRISQGLLRGPVERDRVLGTCRIEVRMARGPLRPPLRMRLDIDRSSPTSTALELIPCQARPAHRRLLPRRPPPAGLSDPRAAEARARNASRTTSARSRPADVPQPQAAPGRARIERISAMPFTVSYNDNGGDNR